MKKVNGIFIMLLFPLCIFAQESALHGKIVSGKNQEPLPGVNIIVDDTSGTATDINGEYRITLSPGQHNILFRFLGFKSIQRTVTISSTQNTELNIEMEESVTELDLVVVSAGKFEQKIEEVTVSMEVIRPQLITNKNTYNLENVMSQVPGVHMVDRQPNIRGGAGYTYGAGSRVLVLVDDMPMLTAATNEVKWSFLPVENLEQIEVIKGASSALFGSSALNGVVNIRTAYPKDNEAGVNKKHTSLTSINIFQGFYSDPVRIDTITGAKRDTNGDFYKPLKWWGNANPVYTGMNMMHSRKINNLDLVAGGNIFSDMGYREGEKEQWGKAFINTRYRFKKIEGLSAGINATTINIRGGWFFMWEDADSGAYRPKGGLDTPNTTITGFTHVNTNVDPFIIYHTKKGGKHSLKNRYLNTAVINETGQNTFDNIFYSEYQYQKRFNNNLTLTGGIVRTNTIVRSTLYGKRVGNSFAGYIQADKRINRLSISAGLRTEYFRIDTAETIYSFRLKSNTVTIPFYPVMRAGLNYRLLEETYLRSSFGQGYRFPSIAEKYINTSVSNINIFPNISLQPETGWSGELGFKQGFKVSDWKGYIDIAGFWTEYNDMIEFVFGLYYPEWIDLDSMTTDTLMVPYLLSHGVPPGNILKALYDSVEKYFGVKAMNIGRAQIKGIEISAAGTGKLGGVTVNLLGGYTYMIPVNFNNDSLYLTTLTDTSSNMLKYRFNHMAKADLEFVYKNFSFGWSIRYNSNIVNIDATFEEPLVIKGVKEYRRNHNKGDIVSDARISFQASKNSKISLVSANVFNSEYMERPGDMQPPRTVAIQYSMKF